MQPKGRFLFSVYSGVYKNSGFWFVLCINVPYVAHYVGQCTVC